MSGFSGVLGPTVETSEITDKAITYAKIQDISATDKLLGRSSANAGVTEEIALTSAGRAIIDDADAAAQRTTLGITGGWKKLHAVTASASATVDLETDIGSTYDVYMIVGSNIHMSSDGASLDCRLKIGGAYKTDGNYNYHTAGPLASGTGYSAVAATSAAKIIIIDDIGNAAQEIANLVMFFHEPDATDNRKTIQWTGSSGNTTTVLKATTGAGDYASASALSGVRFLGSAGNIDSGEFALYGLMKS